MIFILCVEKLGLKIALKIAHIKIVSQNSFFISIESIPTFSCVTLSKLFNLFKPCFPCIDYSRVERMNAMIVLNCLVLLGLNKY